VRLDLRATGTAGGEDNSDDSEEGLASDSLVVPPVSLNEANLHLTALLHLLETIIVTGLLKNGATLQVEDVQHRHSLENKTQSNLFNWLTSGQSGNVERNGGIGASKGDRGGGSFVIANYFRVMIPLS